jgi:hypothetical protein
MESEALARNQAIVASNSANVVPLTISHAITLIIQSQSLACFAHAPMYSCSQASFRALCEQLQAYVGGTASSSSSYFHRSPL